MSPDEGVGTHPNSATVSLALTSVPADVQCLELIVTTPSQKVARRLSVMPGQSSTSLSFGGLPTGTVTVEEKAYGIACSSVQESTAPTWISEAPVMTVLIPGGTAVDLALVLRRPGQIRVSNDFENGPPTGSGLKALASVQGEAADLVVGGGNVYWTSPATAGIYKVSINGGNTIALAMGQMNARHIVLSGTEVFWTTASTIAKAPAAGGPVTVLASGQTPFALAVDPMTNVYWVNSDGRVFRVPRNGGMVVTMATLGITPGGMDLEAGKLYLSSLSSGTVSSIDVLTNVVTTLAMGPAGATRLAADANGIYWINPQTQSLNTMSLSGTGLTTIAMMARPTNLFVDGNNLYVTFRDAGQVLKLAKNGSTRVSVAQGQAGPAGIAVDATNAYWTNMSGMVMTAAK